MSHIQHAELPADPEAFRRLSHSPQHERPTGFVSDRDLIAATETLDESGSYAYQLPDGRRITATPAISQRRRILIERARVTPATDVWAEELDRWRRRTPAILMTELRDEFRQAQDIQTEIGQLEKMRQAKLKTLLDIHEKELASDQLEDVCERAGLVLNCAEGRRITQSELEQADKALAKAQGQLRAAGQRLQLVGRELVQKAQGERLDKHVATVQTCVIKACGAPAYEADLRHLLGNIPSVKSFGTDVRLFPEHDPASWSDCISQLEKLITG